MIELFNGSTLPQNANHFSTKRTFIPTFEISNGSAEGDFCVCRMQCIPALKFFTDEIGVDSSKNDFFSLFQMSIPGGTHKVYITVEDDEPIEITNDDYGTLYTGSTWVSYEFTAFKIFNEIGYKKFYCTIKNFDGSSAVVATLNSAPRQLIKYSDQSANGTITIETNKNGILRHGNNYSDLVLSGGGLVKFIRNQIRLSGSLEWSGAPLESTRLMLSGNTQDSLQVFEKMEMEYDLKIVLASAEQVIPVLLDDLFANAVFVTDYNLFNFEKYSRLKVYRTSNDFTAGRSARRKSFVVKVRRAQSNIEKYND